MWGKMGVGQIRKKCNGLFLIFPNGMYKRSKKAYCDEKINKNISQSSIEENEPS